MHRLILLFATVMLFMCRQGTCQPTAAAGDTFFAEVHQLSLMSQEGYDRLGRAKPSHVRELLRQTEQALQKYPGDRSLLWMKASCLIDLKRLDEAEQVFEQILSQPSTPEQRSMAMEALAAIQWRKGNYQSAWRLLPKRHILKWVGGLILPSLVMVVFAAFAKRWMGSWAVLQAVAMLLLWVCYMVASFFIAWITLGVPIPGAQGNRDTYMLLAYLVFWGGIWAITMLYRRRYFRTHTDCTWPVPRWLLGIASIACAGVLLYQAVWLHMTVVNTNIPRVLQYITIQSVLHLSFGLPLASAIFSLWFVGTVYEQARSNLLPRMGLLGAAIAVGWTVFLSLAIVLPGEGIDLTGSALWTILVFASIIVYERLRQLWFSGLIYAAYAYLTFLPGLLTRVGHL
ncbi:MAG: hypothetical protein KatS3mg023_3025 [Armatimonadota bacterium]|nr:MAG: hypothetical protein KatS3mg023_3025 [Armatimonadota bacterium]